MVDYSFRTRWHFDHALENVWEEIREYGSVAGVVEICAFGREN